MFTPTEMFVGATPVCGVAVSHEADGVAVNDPVLEVRIESVCAGTVPSDPDANVKEVGLAVSRGVVVPPPVEEVTTRDTPTAC
jgi:hypothetical protein